MLLSERFGEVGIERVKGKAAGDVTVTFEDGTIGDEGDLRELLHGTDKNYFQAVFSFDLQGLHGVKNLSEATLGKYLLSAGMIGSDKLLEAETKLQKELDARFKPSGQKPELNARISQLKDLQGRLKKSDEEQRTYKELQMMQNRTEDELSGLKDAIASNEEKLLQYQEFLRVQPLFEQQQTLQERLSELGDLEFPAEGIKRLDQLIALKIPNDAQASALQQKKQEIVTNIDDLKISPYIATNKEKITAVLERSPFLEKMEAEKSRLEQLLRAKERDKEKYKADLFIDLTDDEILKLDTSIFTVEKLKELEQEKHRLKSERVRLDNKYKQEKSNLEATESRINELKARQLPEAERKRLEHKYSSGNNENYASLKKELLEEQILELKQKYSQLSVKDKTNRKRTGIMIGLLAVICLMISAYALVGGQPLLAVITALFAGIATIFYFINNGNDMLDDLKKQVADAENKKKEYEQQTNAGTPLELDSVRQLLQKEEEIQRLLMSETVKHNERSAAFDAVLEESELWEASWSQISGELTSILKGWKISSHSLDYHAGAVLEQLVRLRQVIEEATDLKKELIQLDKDITLQKQELLTVCNCMGIHQANWHELVLAVRQALNQHMQQTLQLGQYNQEKAEIDAEIERLTSQSTYITTEIMQLLDAAMVENEEAFRRKAMLVEETERVRNILQMISIQLDKTPINLQAYEALSSSRVSKYSIEALEAERKELLGRQSAMLAQLSDLKHRIKHLEEGGTYGSLLHQYHEAKAAFNVEAKGWAKYALAKTLLNKTIATFKRERLPKVIGQAEEYLSYLTNGEYIRILLGETVDGLYLERMDGLRFEAGEVSRGTAEQVYAALRLALAGNMLNEDPFPIIIDDSFVNFDRNRTYNMIRLMQKISEVRQVIFFTCHEHLLAHFENRPVTILGKEKATTQTRIQS